MRALARLVTLLLATVPTQVAGAASPRELPKLRRSAFVAQCQNRVGKGLSRPSSARSCATRSGVALWPRIALAASPGRTVVAAYTMIAIRMIVTAPRARRRRTIERIGRVASACEKRRRRLGVAVGGKGAPRGTGGGTMY